MHMNESFSLHDITSLELKETAKIPNKDDITVRSCRGMSLKDKGRNVCPCKAIDQ